jgi:alkanesulfonate monooxygenase SsuD/methylene tetrahydromethanopterin reductase-like flavin-dependent oxidoreductase (luciferase family)
MVKIGFLSNGRRDTITAFEAMGCDSLWAPGHISMGRPVAESIVGLTHLAAATERVEVGTAVLILPLYQPVILAKQLIELDRLTEGRAVLGVGVGGEYPQEFSALQMPLAERGPRADAALPLLRRLWRGETVTENDGFWPMENVNIDPGPRTEGGPPIVVGGRKPPAMRRAAALGDGWLPFLYSPERYASSVTTIKEHAASIGRDLTGFRWLCWVYVAMDDDPDVARQKGAEVIGGAQVGDGSRFQSLLDRVAAAGTPEQVHEKLQRYVEAGAEHLILVPCERDNESLLRTAAHLLSLRTSFSLQ